MEIVKPLLHQTLGREYSDRSKQIIHASDLTNVDFCSREHALHKLHNVTGNTQFISTATKITWEYGRYIESQFRNVWLRNNIIGNWKCLDCGELCEDFITHHEYYWGKNCQCTTNAIRCEYSEPTFTLPNTTFTGSPDCFLQIDGGIIPIEIKTIDKDRFALLKEPELEHVLRCKLYLYLVAHSTHPAKNTIDTSSMQIVYFSKSFGLKDTKVKKYNPADRQFSPIKEYTIERDDSAVSEIVDKLYLHYELEHLQMLPHRICENAECARAQKCNVREICFST